jgi:hypothetical protein
MTECPIHSTWVLNDTFKLYGVYASDVTKSIHHTCEVHFNRFMLHRFRDCVRALVELCQEFSLGSLSVLARMHSVANYSK